MMAITRRRARDILFFIAIMVACQNKTEKALGALPKPFVCGTKPGVLPAIVAVVTAAITTAATTTATTAKTTAATTTATTAAALTGLGFLHNDGSAVHFAVVELFDSSQGLIIVGHFYKSKTFGSAGELVYDDVGRSYFSKFFECCTQIFFLRVVVEFCNKNVHYKQKLKK